MAVFCRLWVPTHLLTHLPTYCMKLLKPFHVLAKIDIEYPDARYPTSQKHYFVKALNAGDAVAFVDWIITRDITHELGKGHRTIQFVVNAAVDLMDEITHSEKIPKDAEVYSL